MARHRRCGIAAATTVYKGGIACKNAAGFLVPASDIAGLSVVGVFEETVVNAGAAGALDAGYATGADFEFVNAAAAVVQATQIVFAADDQSVTTTAVSVHHTRVGTVNEFTAALVWIFIDEQSGTVSV